MAMIGMSDDFSHNRRLLDRILLDRGVFDRVRGAVQPVDRPASQPAEPSRRRGAVHHESPGDGRGARVVHRVPDGRHLLRSPDPNRPVQPFLQARPRCARQAIRQASVPAKTQGHRRQRGGRRTSYWTASPTRSPRPNSNMPLPRRGLRHPRSFNSRNRSRTSAGWPSRTINWSFPGRRRRPNW